MKTAGQSVSTSMSPGAAAAGAGAPGPTGTGAAQSPQIQEMMMKLGPAMMQGSPEQEAMIARIAPMGPPPQPTIPLGAPGMGGIGQTLAGYKQGMTPSVRRPGQMTAGEMQTRPQIPGIGGALGGGY